MREHPHARSEATRLIEEAEARVRAEKPLAALKRADEALRAGEGLPDAWRAAALHARGRAHDLLGDLDAAEVDLAAARDLEPRSPQRWMFMGQLAGSRQQWSTARELFENAIDVAEANNERSLFPQAHRELAHIARTIGDVDRALRELAAAIEVAKKLGDTETVGYSELDLAQLDSEQGESERARERHARVRALADLPRSAIGACPLSPRAQWSRARPWARSLCRPRRIASRCCVSSFHRGWASTRCSSCGSARTRSRCGASCRSGCGIPDAGTPALVRRGLRRDPLDPAPAIAAEIETELEQTRRGAVRSPP